MECFVYAHLQGIRCGVEYRIKPQVDARERLYWTARLNRPGSRSRKVQIRRDGSWAIRIVLLQVVLTNITNTHRKLTGELMFHGKVVFLCVRHLCLVLRTYVGIGGKCSCGRKRRTHCDSGWTSWLIKRLRSKVRNVLESLTLNI